MVIEQVTQIVFHISIVQSGHRQLAAITSRSGLPAVMGNHLIGSNAEQPGGQSLPHAIETDADC